MPAMADIIFTVGGVIFAVALLPSVFGENKPAWKTSLITAVVLTVYAITFATIGFVFSATMNTITAIMWFVLFAQVKFGGLAESG